MSTRSKPPTKLKVPAELSTLRVRTIEVRGHGPFQVCSHIVRIDIDEPGRAGTHGWQVRYAGTSRLFSDAKASKPRSPAASLKEAVEYLSERYSGPKLIQMRRRSSSELPSGISVARIRQRDRPEKIVYVVASSPVSGISPRRFYVGTESTVTENRIQLVIGVAAAYREGLIKGLEHVISDAYLRKVRSAQD
jgi:hypothetical protein